MIAGLSRQRVLGLPAEFDIRRLSSKYIAASLEEQTLFAATHYEYRRCMHVDSRELF